MPRVAIIGLGLIGGSIGLALKRAGLESLEIAGHDNEWGVAAKAKKCGAIDVEERHPTLAVEGAAIVVIATPISKVPAVFEDIAPALGENAVVTDTASTKRDIVRIAQKALPEGVHFVGGHPIAGKETSGIDAADAALFDGRPWAVTPSVHASERAIQTVENLIQLLGAQPVLIDADEHDAYMAAVSHLPLVAATALFSLVRESQGWAELGSLAGPGFRDTTRLASTDPGLSHDIALTNRENLLHWLDRYIEELRRYRGLIADADAQERLLEVFVRAQTERDIFVEHPPERPRPEVHRDDLTPGERMASLFTGEYVIRRRKDIEKLMQERENPRRGER
jgi:prephenate dehydrogenase